MDIEKFYNDFYNTHKNNASIYDISTGNRFGDNVIAVSYISNDDYNNLKNELPQLYKNYIVHLTGPIWGIGGLIPEYREKIETLQSIYQYNVYDSPENKVLREIIKETQAEEEKLWESWSFEEKRKWISDYIKKRRKTYSDFANCGDKFLLDD